MPEIPFGEYFSVETRWDVVAEPSAPDGAPRCRACPSALSTAPSTQVAVATRDLNPSGWSQTGNYARHTGLENSVAAAALQSRPLPALQFCAEWYARAGDSGCNALLHASLLLGLPICIKESVLSSLSLTAQDKRGGAAVRALKPARRARAGDVARVHPVLEGHAVPRHDRALHAGRQPRGARGAAGRGGRQHGGRRGRQAEP